MAKAFISSFGLEPKSIISSVSADGAISAAPTPCAARAAISTPVESARPAPSDPATRTSQPAEKTRFAPNRSDSRPPSSSRPPSATTYALKTQERSSGLEAQIRLDLGQGHADDRRVHDRHELRERDDGERRPAPRIRGLHRGLPF